MPTCACAGFSRSFGILMGSDSVVCVGRRLLAVILARPFRVAGCETVLRRRVAFRRQSVFAAPRDVLVLTSVHANKTSIWSCFCAGAYLYGHVNEANVTSPVESRIRAVPSLPGAYQRAPAGTACRVQRPDPVQIVATSGSFVRD